MVVDSSGNDNMGSLVGATRVSGGVFGDALGFDGSSDRVVVQDSASLHLHGAMTLEAWVKPAEVASRWRDVVYKGDDNYYLEATAPRRRAPAGAATFGGTRGRVFGRSPLPVDSWTHLAVTYDGATLQLYVDGEQVAAAPQSGTIDSSSHPLELGGDSIYGQYFKGSIDEVRVYDVARSAAEIRTDMSTAVASGESQDSAPPSAPGTPTATANSATQVDLSWGAATDDVGGTAYQIERCQGSGCSDFTPLASTADTSYSDKSASAETTYSYRVRATDAAGNTGPYSETATVTTPAAVVATGPGPLRVDPGGRYLVDRYGAPFLMTGESPQALIGNLTVADAAVFLSTRRAQGFNTVWINLLCNASTGCRSDGKTWDDIPPFTTPGDVSTPNEAYFARADRMVRLAAEYGYVVLLDPAETLGWLDMLKANGVERDRLYGQYLGRRYGGFSNIIWMSGNDYFWNSDYDAYVTAVAQGIRDTNPPALQTVLLDYPTSGSLDDAAWEPLIDLNASYTYQPTYVQLLKDYNRSNFLPTFLAEASYEGEHNAGAFEGTPQRLRRQEYWSLLSGATGQLYGSRYTWQFLCAQRDGDGNCVGGWKDQLGSPGAMQMAYLVALFSSRRWYELVPDQQHTLLTSGYGSFGGDDYVTAARTPDGKLAIAYVPSARTITIDLQTLAGPVTARWYDPTTGTFTAIGNGPLATNGPISLDTPGANADHQDDWVLVLEAP